MFDIVQRVITNTPLTDAQQHAVLWVTLSLIAAYFIVSRIPVKPVKKDIWNVRNRNRKKTPPSSKDGKG